MKLSFRAERGISYCPAKRFLVALRVHRERAPRNDNVVAWTRVPRLVGGAGARGARPSTLRLRSGQASLGMNFAGLSWPLSFPPESPWRRVLRQGPDANFAARLRRREHLLQIG